MITRRQTRLGAQENISAIGKRKATESPMEKSTRKRSAFGDITNALRNVRISSDNKSTNAVSKSLKKSAVAATTNNENIFNKKFVKSGRVQKKSCDKNASDLKNSRSLSCVPEIVNSSDDSGNDQNKGNDFTKIIDHDQQHKASSLPCSQVDQDQSFKSVVSDLPPVLEAECEPAKLEETKILQPVKFAEAPDLEGPAPIEDPAPEYNYDQENEMDPFNVPEFAREIFAYYLMRETDFAVTDYMCNQPTITKQMRAILVDWMVEIQESFELNHETLYQAVKMTDLYLSRKSVDKKNLQLVGTTSLFISSKFDERCPPPSEDFLYICDDAYTRKQLLEMERDMLMALHFDIGFPISYRFLRRYAKASKVSMETLTLARYILESSLLFYECLHFKDSLLAAGCLLLALRMKNEGDWTNILEKYSSYNQHDVSPVMWVLNDKMTAPSLHGRNLNNIKTKYSHEVFFNVTQVPFLANKGINPLLSPDENV